MGISDVIKELLDLGIEDDFSVFHVEIFEAALVSDELGDFVLEVSGLLFKGLLLIGKCILEILLELVKISSELLVLKRICIRVITNMIEGVLLDFCSFKFSFSLCCRTNPRLL